MAKVAALISGGKDSLYAAYQAQKQGHEIVALIAMKSENAESYMFHTANIDLVLLQSQSWGKPLIFAKTKGEKEKELEDLKKAINKAKEQFGIEGIVTGALYSKYQKERIDNIAKDLRLESLAPLWHKKPKEQWKEMLDLGFEVMIVEVAANKLYSEWLGKIIKEKEVEKLCCLHETCYICTGGEGGEFESLVLDCPLFKKKIKILDSETKWNESTESGEFIIKNAILEDKA